MKKYKNILHIFLLLFIIGVTACSDDDEVTPRNELVALAGEDQTITVNTEIELDGTASFDKANKPFTFSWSIKTKPVTSAATLKSPNAGKTAFTPDVAGPYIIELVLTQGNWTAKDQVTITVTSDEPNGPTTVIINQDINTATTLANIFDDPAIPDYIVTTDVNVRADLTIEPGVVIYFNDHSGLQIIEGTFKAVGTENKLVVLEGYGNYAAQWKGLVIHSNSEENEMRFVSVREAGSIAHFETGIRAAITLAGSPLSGAALKMTNVSIEKSGGFGLFVAGMSVLNSFAENQFSQNAYSAAYIPAEQLDVVDANSNFSGNGFNGIETYGTVQKNTEVQWKKLNNGAYLISNHLTLKSGITIESGATFKIGSQVTISVINDGYLNSTGNAQAGIVFTALNNEYWNGIFINSTSTQNKLHFTEISYAGFTKIEDTSHEANIAVGPNGKVSVQNSEIKFGKGYGLVSKTRDQVNADIVAANSFHNLLKGLVFPVVLQYPDMPSLEGEWFDHWTFFNGGTAVAQSFYNQSTQTWFNGASNPWTMSSGKGMGIHISANKQFIWAAAEQSPWSGCESYSAEYMTGTVSWTDETVSFNQQYWRSKFINSCDPSQDVDIDVETSEVVLPYVITKVYNLFTGEEYWELKFRNPDNSTFSFYRK